MSKLFYTSYEALSEANQISSTKASSEQLKNNLIEGMPFVLSDDGSPIRELNEWLRSLPSNGASSPKTWLAYSLDLIDWYDFFSKRDNTVLTADKTDLAAYHAERRLGDGGAARLLSSSSWNRKIAAIESFYAWAVENSLIQKAPFSYRYSRASLSTGQNINIKQNLAKEKTGRAHASIKWLSQEQLDAFVNVGVNGLLPSGEEDPDFKGRNAARNRAFVELLSTTGMRVQEASSILENELPAVENAKQQFVRMELPGAICKGGATRGILIPPSTLRTIDSYKLIERDFALERANFSPKSPLEFSELSHNNLKIDNNKTSLSKLSVDKRRNLVNKGKSPLLFLQNNGNPVTNWEQVFQAATLRCQKFDKQFPDVTPHTLRHTYAVNMLQYLIEQVAKGINRQTNDEQTKLSAGYWRVYDPILTLRDLLGHASVSTTQIYLSAIDATRWYSNYIEETEDEQ